MEKQEAVKPLQTTPETKGEKIWALRTDWRDHAVLWFSDGVGVAVRVACPTVALERYGVKPKEMIATAGALKAQHTEQCGCGFVGRESPREEQAA